MMPTFAIKIKNCPMVQDYFKKADEKLHKDFFVSYGQRVPNVLKGRVYRLESYPDDIYIIEANYTIPNFMPYIAFFTAAPILFFAGFRLSAWLIIPTAFLLMGFFWSNRFIFLVNKLSLRKLGFTDKVKLFRDKDTISSLVNRLL